MSKKVIRISLMLYLQLINMGLVAVILYLLRNITTFHRNFAEYSLYCGDGSHRPNICSIESDRGIITLFALALYFTPSLLFIYWRVQKTPNNSPSVKAMLAGQWLLWLVAVALSIYLVSRVGAY